MAIVLPPALGHLATAEEFLAFFDIAYDAHVVRVSRLHILQRFHDYLATAEPAEDGRSDLPAIGALLARAYGDFVRSDPLTERVFKVLKEAQERPVQPPGRASIQRQLYKELAAEEHEHVALLTTEYERWKLGMPGHL
jgi:nitrogenase-stabilizing/protective protein